MTVQQNLMGIYGQWVDSIAGDDPKELSYRHESWSDCETWRVRAREQVDECTARPDTGETSDVTITDQYTYDGLHIEELSWQLPYGHPTEAVVLRPTGSEQFPGILALHDHSGDKYFGKRKIARTQESMHPALSENRERLYDGTAWANEIAKRGYTVLVHDGFTFGSRRIHPDAVGVSKDVYSGRSDQLVEQPAAIAEYNRWAVAHESVIAKSLLCAGTTFAGTLLAEDQRALDVLCSRSDVDATRVGCGGLSGGGLRTVYLGGMDSRITCAVCAGMMTTWNDYMLQTADHHSWMVFTPLLAQYMDYPDILSLRVPRATLVLNNQDDHLFTLPEMERADTMLRETYEKADASERYRCSYYPGPHKFNTDMQAEAFDWFDQILG